MKMRVLRLLGYTGVKGAGLGRGRVWAVLPLQQPPQLILWGVLGLDEAGGQAFVPSISHSLGTEVCFIASPSWQMLLLSLMPQSISVTHCSLCLNGPFLHTDELQLILQVHRPFPLALKSV